ncbi:MAG: glycosyltransferase, partial [Clostridia bacterium]
QYREGFSMVNTEAMASGIPVIASSRGGIRNIIRHGKSGLLVNAYTSPLAFAKRLAQLKASPALAQRLAAGGRSRALAAYSWSNRVQRLMQLYQAIRHR